MRRTGAGTGSDDQDLRAWIDDGYAPAFRTAYLILHNRADAEEAVQEAFLRAWRFRAAIPTGDGVRPWLYRVVVNACLSKLRAERSRASTAARLGWLASTQESAGPEDQVEGADIEYAVRAAIAALPEHLRVVVVLRYYARCSEREIAAIIHRRAGTVKSRLHQARARLSEDPNLKAYEPGRAVAAGMERDID